MNYRLNTIFEEKSYSADATEVIDLNLLDCISMLFIELQANITNDESITAHVMECLKKIELVDGSDVLFSLTGKESDSVDWYHNHKIRSPWNIYMGWGQTERLIGINFGRFLWDSMLSLNPSKFRNLQLKLTLDIDAGGAVPTTNKLKVWAALFDKKTVDPIGFLMHKEIKDIAMAASTHIYSDLPTDFPYRKLFIRQQTLGTEPGQHIDKIKLSEDQDKCVPFNHIPDEILRTIAYDSPCFEEDIHARVAATATHIYSTPTTRQKTLATEIGDTSASGAIATNGGAGGLIHAIATTGGKYVQFIARGYLPHGVYEIPFGIQSDPDDWYDVSKLGSLKLDITCGSGALATDSVQIFLQQLRKY